MSEKKITKMRPNIVAIVQARMGSTRLPGKALLPLGGDSALGLLLTRLSRARSISRVVVATSMRPENDALAVFCTNRAVRCFRGDEENVLGRFLNCAEAESADIIVRVTGDEPFIDPEIIDRTVEKFMEGEADIVSTGYGRSIPKGLDCEVFSVATLQRIASMARTAYDQEHVTSLAYNSREFRITNIRDRVAPEEYRPEIELTLDDEGDYAFLKCLARRVTPLTSLAGLIAACDAIRATYYTRHGHKKYHITYLITACRLYGTGHLHTARAVAKALRREIETTFNFIIPHYPGATQAVQLLRDEGYEVRLVPIGGETCAIDSMKPDAVIIDIDSRTADIETLRTIAARHPVIYFDYVGINGFWPRAIFNRNILFDKSSYEERPGTAYYVGAQFFPLLAPRTPRRHSTQNVPRVLISLGGSDPCKHTERIVRELLAWRGNAMITVVLGVLYSGDAKLRRLANGDRRIRIIGPERDLPRLIVRSDLLLTNSGRTAYEACALGVPIAVYPQNEMEEQVARELVKRRAARYGPTAKAGTHIVALCREAKKMRTHQQTITDLRGAERVATRIAMLLSNAKKQNI